MLNKLRKKLNWDYPIHALHIHTHAHTYSVRLLTLLITAYCRTECAKSCSRPKAFSTFKLLLFSLFIVVTIAVAVVTAFCSI